MHYGGNYKVFVFITFSYSNEMNLRFFFLEFLIWSPLQFLFVPTIRYKRVHQKRQFIGKVKSGISLTTVSYGLFQLKKFVLEASSLVQIHYVLIE